MKAKVLKVASEGKKNNYDQYNFMIEVEGYQGKNTLYTAKSDKPDVEVGKEYEFEVKEWSNDRGTTYFLKQQSKKFGGAKKDYKKEAVFVAYSGVVNLIANGRVELSDFGSTLDAHIKALQAKV